MKYLATNGGLEGLFWLVVAVVWVLVQLLGRSVRRPPPAPSKGRPTEPSVGESSLEEFLRSLGAEVPTGLRPADKPQPVASTAMPAKASSRPGPSRPPRKRRGQVELTPPAVVETAAGKIAGVEPALEAGGKHIRRLLVIPRIPAMDLRGLAVPGVVFRGNTVSTVRPGPPPFSLKGRAALRSAMLHRLILEPPHALRL